MIPCMEPSNARKGFAGLRVLSLESRRANEMAKLISNYGGEPIVAPSMREVPLESNTDALAFARNLAAGGFDMAIFLTGVGTRALARVVETVYPLDQFAAALRKISVVARGPKPVAALDRIGSPGNLGGTGAEYLARSFARARRKIRRAASQGAPRGRCRNTVLRTPNCSRGLRTAVQS